MRVKGFLVFLSGLITGGILGWFMLSLFGIITPGGLDLSRWIGGVPVSQSPAVGSPALDFQLTALDGKQYQLSDLKGKVVLINFWATWCQPCREEMPLIQSTADRFSSDLIVLGVNDDEDRETVTQFVQEIGLKFPVLLDPGEKVTTLYQIRGFPTTFVLDRDGIVRAMHIGIMSQANLNGYLKQAGLNP